MLRTRLAILMAALATMPTPLAVQAKDGDGGFSSADATQLQSALNRGELLYAYDQAAWHGTDDMRAQLPDAAAKIGGWVVDGPRKAPHLVFYSRDQANPKAVYIADFADNKLVSSKVIGPGDNATLTPAQLKLIDARRRVQAALPGAGIAMCAASRPNMVVLPPETPGGPYLVYVMTPYLKANTVPMGGHFLFEVAADGTVGAPRTFTRSCIDLPTSSDDSGKPVGLLITHLLDPVPTEIHVFSTRMAGLPLYVSTTQNKRLWAVEIVSGSARIRRVQALGK